MRTLYLIVVPIIPLLAPLPVHARWQSARDNQSATALAAMSNEQLFDEAFDVCVRRALLESLPSATDETRRALSECSDYLNTLSPFVREHNGGTVPPWMTELGSAHTTKECQDAFRMFLSKTDKPAAVGQRKRPAAARAPQPAAMPKATPAPPRSPWSEQLPPWIAPQ
jgi:hypothetical protein